MVHSMLLRPRPCSRDTLMLPLPLPRLLRWDRATGREEEEEEELMLLPLVVVVVVLGLLLMLLPPPPTGLQERGRFRPGLRGCSRL